MDGEKQSKSGTGKNPLATIIVRAYNQEKLVAHAIQSCFDQSYSPLEIILSDDCSQDGTWNVIQRMAADYDGLHSVVINRNSTNLGIVGHANMTMQGASGTLILSCAGDDIAFPEKTTTLVDAWRKDPNRIKAVSSPVVVMTQDGEDVGIRTPFSNRPKVPEPTAMDVITRKAWSLGAATLWHRDVIDKFGPISSQAFSEDKQLLLRASLLGRVIFVDKPLLRYRLGGVSNPVQESHFGDYFENRKKYCQNRLGTMLGFLNILEKTEFEAGTGLEKVVRRRTDALEFELELGRLSSSECRAKLPIAFYKSARRANLSYILAVLKHSFPSAFIGFKRRMQSRLSAENGAKFGF